MTSPSVAGENNTQQISAFFIILSLLRRSKCTGKDWASSLTENFAVNLKITQIYNLTPHNERDSCIFIWD